MKIKMAWDLDGTIADMNTIITNISGRHLGIELTPMDTENYFLRFCYGGMSLDMEKEIIAEALTAESTKELKPIKGAIEALIEWQEVTGDLIEIVTAREDPAALSPFLEKYMVDKVDFLVHYGHHKKGKFCKARGITHFIDDFIFNLVDLANHGRIPIIFDQPYNRQIPRRMARLAQRVYSWKHFRSLYLHSKPPKI
jgi:hypothetical protein